jgi:uncharacterized membrane protein
LRPVRMHERVGEHSAVVCMLSFPFRLSARRTRGRPPDASYHNYLLNNVPVFYVALAFVLAYFIPRINYRVFPWLVSPLPAEIVIAFLSAVSTGMIALTGIVFSLAFVLVQYGTSTYSPRMVNASRRNVFPHAVGVFTGTFIFCLLALRGVDVKALGGSGSLTLWVALFWLLASVVVLMRLVVRVGDMTITRILFFLEKAGGDAIDRTFGASLTTRAQKKQGPESKNISAPVSQVVRYLGAARYLIGIRAAVLLELAIRYDACINLHRAIGDPLSEDDVLMTIHGTGSRIPEHELLSCIVLNWERTLKSDPAYALRLLVDIAIRALSPAVNDPTTAVQVLDHIEALLIRLGNANLEVGNIRDTTGRLRLSYAATTWDEYVNLALLEILHFGAASLQVHRRLAALLTEVRNAIPVQRHPAIERIERERLTVVEQAIPYDLHRTVARIPDVQGLGHSLPPPAYSRQ